MTGVVDAMLVVEKGVSDASVIPLDHPLCVLGKSPAATIVLDNPYVSRRHAQIEQRAEHFEIHDLGSKNGTFINGVLLQQQTVRLHNGDRVDLGKDQVVLRFQQWGATVTLPPIHQSSSGDLVVNVSSREVVIRGQRAEPPFSRKEFDVLSLLYRRRGQACSKDEIAEAGWPERGGGDVADQDIEQYVRRLRLRIEPDPSHPQYLLTVRGYGYRLSDG